MREQEDKIYALEDYLAQYQQLLCDARQENSQLRRQLAKRKASASPTPAETTGPKPWSPDREDGPSIGPVGPPEIEPLESAPIEVEPTGPEVPPLDATSLRAVDVPNDEGQLRDVTSITMPPKTVGLSSAAGLPAADAKDPRDEDEPRGLMIWADDPMPGPPSHVWLNGEAFPGYDGSGPRLLVDVEPLAGGGPAIFGGPLSLMILDPEGPPGRRSLARWDFSADEVQHAAERVANGRALRFRLQLPDDLPSERPLELWVRLVDGEAGKLLAHVGIDLEDRSRFSSIRPPAPARRVADATHDRELAESRAQAERPGWSQWQTARPGESNLLAERTGRAEGSWQAAATPPPATALGLPMPAVVPATAEIEQPSQPSDDRYATDQAVVVPPSWSPTR